MKKIFYVILLAISSTIVGQVREELNYYPLHVGDVWQYKITYMPQSGISSYFHMLKTVKGDTTLTNGKKYFVVVQPPFTWEKFDKPEIAYLRIDTAKGSVRRLNVSNYDEVQTDSLFCNNNSSFNRSFHCTFSETNVLGRNTKIMNVVAGISSNGGAFYKLAMNLGLFKADKYFANVTAEGNQYDLVYAKINGKEYGTYVSVEYEEPIPSEFSLSQNYPNPFNPETTIEYSIPKAEFVTLKVFDILGKEVATLVNEFKQPGVYSSKFNTLRSSLPSGIYFYGLKAGNFIKTNKMVLLK